MSEVAQEFQVSPDGKWLAFRERFNAYITPFVETGRRVDIGPKSKAVPVTRVSKDTGEFLHFSGDSSRLYWAEGPELFQRDLKDAFAFLPGAPEKLPEPPAQGVNISFEAPIDRPPRLERRRLHGGPCRHDEGRRGHRGRRGSHRGQPHPGGWPQGPGLDPRQRQNDRRDGKDGPPGFRRRALARLLWRRRIDSAAELGSRTPRSRSA